MQRYRSLFRWRHLLWPPRFRPYAVPVQMIDDTKSCSPKEGTTTRILCDWEKWIESWVANNLHPSDITSAFTHLSDISANQVPHDRLIPLVSFLLLSHFLLQPSKKVTKTLFFQNFGNWRETIWFCMYSFLWLPSSRAPSSTGQSCHRVVETPIWSVWNYNQYKLILIRKNKCGTLCCRKLTLELEWYWKEAELFLKRLLSLISSISVNCKYKGPQ